MIASANGRCATVLLLLAAKADVNLADRRWRMPLHHAALNGEKRAARLLMRNGAEPMAKTKTQGWTALHLAAGCKHPDLQMVFLLLGGPDHYLDEPRPSEEERAVVVALKEEERDKTARSGSRQDDYVARVSRSQSVFEG
ncbi:hypothetical protein T484DRAFT_1830955 [Baffinella frigidus]|nr:hypothetical protein T484DRAFT_1830955 [Cryptophyta sp. CCMP2293]